MASSLLHMSMHATPLTDQTLNISLVSTNIPPLEPNTFAFVVPKGIQSALDIILTDIFAKTIERGFSIVDYLDKLIPSTVPNAGHLIELYNGLMTGSYRRKLKADFASEKVRVIVVTDTAAYGFDAPNVRRADLEEMEQKFGCAGRDGQPAETIAFAP
jgi:hypothetical protein